MNSDRQHFGIIGGGLLGLTLALRLAERGHGVTVLEAGDRLGGLADAWQLGDITWDRHYHVTLASDTSLRRLLRDLQLEDQLRWSRTKTAFLSDRHLLSMSNNLEFLRFPLLRMADKIRLAWTIWHASRIDDWERLEQIPVDQWLIKHSGRRTFEKLWLPLLKAKLGDAWQRTSAAFIWATIQRMYAARDDSARHEQFGYVSGGYATVLAALSDRLESLGITIECGYAAESISPDTITGGLVVTGADRQSFHFDRVVTTAPAAITAKLCPDLSQEEQTRLQDIEYLGIVCPSLLLRKPLAGYYVTNLTETAPYTGVIEMSALVAPNEIADHGLVYLPKYATTSDPIWQQSDEAIREAFLAELARTYPDFCRDDLLAFRVSRAKHVFALSTLNYSRHLPPVTTSVPGLFVVNSAQIVNGTLNVNETVRLAERSLDELCQPKRGSTQKGTSADERAVGELIARPR